MKNTDFEQFIDFGVNDFVLRRINFTSQDFARLLISKFGAIQNYFKVAIDYC